MAHPARRSKTAPTLLALVAMTSAGCASDDAAQKQDRSASAEDSGASAAGKSEPASPPLGPVDPAIWKGCARQTGPQGLDFRCPKGLVRLMRLSHDQAITEDVLTRVELDAAEGFIKGAKLEGATPGMEVLPTAGEPLSHHVVRARGSAGQVMIGRFLALGLPEEPPQVLLVVCAASDDEWCKLSLRYLVEVGQPEVAAASAAPDAIDQIAPPPPALQTLLDEMRKGAFVREGYDSAAAWSSAVELGADPATPPEGRTAAAMDLIYAHYAAGLASAPREVLEDEVVSTFAAGSPRDPVRLARFKAVAELLVPGEDGEKTGADLLALIKKKGRDAALHFASFHCRAQRTEARRNLEQLRGLEHAYRKKKGKYGSAKAVGFEHQGPGLYVVKVVTAKKKDLLLRATGTRSLVKGDVVEIEGEGELTVREDACAEGPMAKLVDG